ncbi:MAG TPA: hypothetical protein PLA93_02115 [Acinetobacter towneri]|uniref:hypothetical protein n=1 Tax=Acinetobacter TaxID=469 RepID=UPI001D18AE7A|nr:MULTISPECIES: hypothetical protein [Acinetobacter]HRO77521.1 hypothetical protein [Acinetobacter towneri]
MTQHSTSKTIALGMAVRRCIGKEEECIPTQAIPITQARPINCSMNIKLIIFIGMHHKAHRSGLQQNNLIPAIAILNAIAFERLYELCP